MNNFSLLQAAPAGGGMGINLIMIVAMIAVFYFLILGPQRKQRKKEEEMRKNLTKGDKIVTIGGIKGIVSYIDEKTSDVTVKVDDNSKLTFVRAAIARVEGDVVDNKKDKKDRKSDKKDEVKEEAKPIDGKAEKSKENN